MVGRNFLFITILSIILIFLNFFNYEIYATSTVDEVMEGAQNFIDQGDTRANK